MAKNDKITGSDIEAMEDAPTGAFIEPQAPESMGGKDGEMTEKQQDEINAFLDEFACNDSRRKELLKNIKENAKMEGSKYFVSRYNKIKEVLHGKTETQS